MPQQNSDQKEVEIYFQNLGEVWRDITAIEFLMRCAIAKKDGEEFKIPKYPYTKGRIYQDYPKSFYYTYFSDVVMAFNNYFPKCQIPLELVELRNAMAHGLFTHIGDKKIPDLYKFRFCKKNSTLEVDFSIELTPQKFAQLKQSIMEFRRFIMIEIKNLG